MTIASEITRLQNDKAAMCAAIENKGVTVGNVTLDSYAACIDAISAGGEKVGYIDYLMIGGGGGGGRGTSSSGGGGGGGGGFIEGICEAIFSRNYQITIGCGGGCAQKGGDTVFYGVAYGGGAGCNTMNLMSGDCYNCNGASGGGGGKATHGTQGNDGCLGRYGGGGAGGVGTTTSGGAGKQSSISGENCYYSGGGGGYYGSQSGGIGGGGNGAVNGCNATYYGGGGGGGCNIVGSGCQGIVIIRYKSDGSCGFSNATGGCKYLCNGYCVHCFTTDGVFTPII